VMGCDASDSEAVGGCCIRGLLLSQ
jgi:hypothetical protein